MTQTQLLNHIVISHFFIDHEQIGLRMRYIRNTMLLIKKTDEDRNLKTHGISPDLFTTIVQWVHDRLLIDEHYRHLGRELIGLIDEVTIENHAIERLNIRYATSKEALHAIASTIRDTQGNEIDPFDELVHLMIRSNHWKEKLAFFLAEIRYIRAILFLAYKSMKIQKRHILASIKNAVVRDEAAGIKSRQIEIRELEDVIATNEESIRFLEEKNDPSSSAKMTLLENYNKTMKDKIERLRTTKTEDQINDEIKKRFVENTTHVFFRRQYIVVRRELESLDVFMNISNVITPVQTVRVAG